MQIRWSPEAAEDFEAAIHRILDENPTAAPTSESLLLGSAHRFRSGRCAT